MEYPKQNIPIYCHLKDGGKTTAMFYMNGGKPTFAAYGNDITDHVIGWELKKWTEYLSQDVYNRLATCRSTKADILPLAKAKWAVIQHKEGFTQEDALVAVLELLDCNNCCFDLTIDEYNDILSCIQ